MSPLLISCLPHLDAPLGAATLVSDFSTADPFYSQEPVLNTSLTLAKSLDCGSDTSTVLSDVDVTCVQGIPAGNLTLASYDLATPWGVVVDGDYVLDDIASSIRVGVYARVPILWSTTECDFCYSPPSTLPHRTAVRIGPDAPAVL